ncbi:hypothetical protein SNE40_021152 [Patella caerulea]|uniref:Uncharacterized protein n=1 Tax=Patella caerulea TaxID=87958 RepID=A0AAN8J0G3_PATCE
MPLKAKERAQRYRDRIKADTDRHKTYLENEREGWLKRTNTGKVKSIDDLSERAKRQKCKAWKKASQRYQVKKRETRQIEEYIQLNSLPTSPVDLEPPAQAFAFGVGPAPRPPNNRGRRRMHHLNRSRTVRKLHKVEQELKQQERLVEKYKKRLNRLKSKEIKKMLSEKDSPRTKTNRLIREFGNGNMTSKVRKTLIFHHTLVEELKQKRKKGRQAKLNSRISGKVLAKYRLLDEARKQLKISRRQLQVKGGPVKKQGNPGIPRTYKERILTFYERDDVSRIKPGKRDTITKQKNKKQIRLLTDTLLNLYNKFMSENTFIWVSYSSFCNLRPFWVKPPSLKDRDTCQCKRHENAQLLIEKLVSLKLTSSAFSSVDTFVDSLCCKFSLECMMGKCEQCQDKSIKVPDENVLDNRTVWYQWENSKKSVVTAKKSSGAEEIKEIKIVVKQKIDGSVQEMIKCLEEQIPELCEHVYNLRHQFHLSKLLKTYCSSKSDHAIIHIDFSENWESKYGNEIQSVHFGGSHVQVTLHTGILYIAEDCIPFCTISDARRHDLQAIWANLDPVFSYISQHYPDVRYLHFQSDGPSTQ